MPAQGRLLESVYELRESAQLKDTFHWCHLPWQWWLQDVDFRAGVKKLQSLWRTPEWENETDWLLILLTMTRPTFQGAAEGVQPGSRGSDAAQ